MQFWHRGQLLGRKISSFLIKLHFFVTTWNIFVPGWQKPKRGGRSPQLSWLILHSYPGWKVDTLMWMQGVILWSSWRESARLFKIRVQNAVCFLHQERGWARGPIISDGNNIAFYQMAILEESTAYLKSQVTAQHWKHDFHLVGWCRNKWKFGRARLIERKWCIYLKRLILDSFRNSKIHFIQKTIVIYL